ncbi:MAG: LytTR family DNA-binding domain-containing protein, partial [Pseudomonadota bacterium]
GAWLVLSTSQSLHFYFYFEQSLWDSIRWSVRDWLVWYLIFATVFALCRRYNLLTRLSLRSIAIVAGIAVASGLVQSLIITSLDFIAGTASRPFFDDFLHFYNKRWLQHLFIFGFFWMLLLRYFHTDTTSADVQKPVADTGDKEVFDNYIAVGSDSATLRIVDSGDVHWISPADVLFVESVGNYLCYHTPDRRIVARGTLKAVHQSLELRHFLRTSRSHIVNPKSIVRRRRSGRHIELLLSGGQTLRVGPSYRSAVDEHLAVK